MFLLILGLLRDWIITLGREHCDMWIDFAVTALRNIAKHKLYSFINIAGLATGLTCAILILLFVRDEMSFDRWLPQTTDLYRLENRVNVPGRSPLDLAGSPFPVPAAMKDHVPEVQAITRMAPESMTFTVGDRQFFDAIQVVDPNFLQVIRLPLVAGDPTRVLSEPESLVLSQSMARKYFGDANPVGRIVTVGNAGCKNDDTECLSHPISLRVTGVLRDVPYNSQLAVNALMPNTSNADRLSREAKESWTSFNDYAFVALARGAAPLAVIRKMAPVLDRSLGKELGMPGSLALNLHLTPFVQVHLNSEQWSGNPTPAGSWITVYGVCAIGLLILLVACFNFTNLATSRALLRAREISLRKCLGARRWQLIVQFLGEAVLMSLISMAFALAMVEVLLPSFNQFLGRTIVFNYLTDWPLLLVIGTVSIGAGLLSGSYPALVLSAFRPASVLRINNLGGPGSGRLRTVLVVLQFSVSIGLGIAAIVVFSQINFARNVDLGFQHDRIMVLAGGSRLSPASRESFANILRTNPGVLDIALSNKVPFGKSANVGLVELPGTSGKFAINRVSISPDFARLYGIPVIAGRTFSRAREQDIFVDNLVPTNEGHNVVINEAAARRLGLSPQQAVGKTIIFDRYHVYIIGVLGDTKFEGAREQAKPLIYYNDTSQNSVFSIKVRGERLANTIAFVDKTWHGFAPSTSPQRFFLNDDFGKLYDADQRQGEMFGVFVFVAIAIACLGLFGLAAFTAGRRTKEIGIRKVFGARVVQIVWLLLTQFSMPVLLANLIAWPVAWYYLSHWLQGYAYRINLSPIYFIEVGLAALMIAWVTVLSHALRVAHANPIHALRHE